MFALLFLGLAKEVKGATVLAPDIGAAPESQTNQAVVVDANGAVAQMRVADKTGGGPPPSLGGPQSDAGPAARRDPVMWLHVHKCGGTLMCEVAQRAGERVVTPNKNCNWEQGDGVQFMDRPSSEPTCDERRQYFHANAFTWGAIEHELRDGHPCDGFLYGTMLREPMGLVDSIASVHALDNPRSEAADGSRWTTNVLNPLQPNGTQEHVQAMTLKAMSKPMPEHIWNLQSWVYLDNFQTRIFAHALDVPAGELTEAHFAKAQATLADFDVVVVMEDLHEEAPRFVSTFQWPQETLKSFASTVNGHASGDIFTSDELELLRKANHFDDKLVKSFRAAARPLVPGPQ